MSPEMALPLFVTLLETITPRYDGTSSTGDELFPGRDAQLPPHVGVSGLGEPAKPLNELGPGPPLKLLSDDHEWLHQVSVVVGAAAATVWSPRTNEPRDVKPNTIAESVSPEGR